MKSLKSFLALPGLIFILSACYKPGCTDPLATNYDPKVKTEDLSCTYTGNVIFWMKASTRDSLILLEHTMLRFELEGELVDSMATSGFTSVSATCNVGGAKTIVRNFTGNTERNYKFRVKGLNFETIYEDFIILKAEDCTAIELK